MPYIKPTDREFLDTTPVDQLDALRAGELTYLLYRLMVNSLPADAKYHDYAMILGCAESAKQEFYRRKVAPYEDQKIQENGDV